MSRLRVRPEMGFDAVVDRVDLRRYAWAQIVLT